MTWKSWCRKGSVANFQTLNRVGVNNWSQFELTPDGMPFPEGATSDRGETGNLESYGSIWSVGRQAVVNDDVGLIADMSRSLAMAGRRIPDDLLYTSLALNSGNGPTMSDTVALFNSAHNNLAGSGAALSTTTLGAARLAMRRQRDENTQRLTNVTGNLINVVPAVLLIPAALEQAADELVNSVFRPDPASAGNQISTTRWVAALDVVVEPRLDDQSATAYFVCASQATNPAYEIAFLNGNEAPVLSRLPESEANGFAWKAFVDCGVIALDWHGVYRNAGA